MPNIFHQSVEDILKAATPEQKILWNHVFLRFGERVSVSQYYYSGMLTGSELATYVARKMYLGCQVMFSSNSTAGTGFQLFDENNVANNWILVGGYAYWDATAAALRTLNGSKTEHNLLFSRATIISGLAQHIQFIGYRLIY